MASHAQKIYGDLNQDGKLSIADVTFLCNMLLANEENVEDMSAVSELAARIDSIEKKLGIVYPYKKDQQDEKPSHEYVDLGLTSGTLWATCNVGAENPEDYGDYYAWGETLPQADNKYFWDSYNYCNGSNTKLTRYCTSDSYWDFFSGPSPDGKTELDAEDDAATVNWGKGWCTPSRSQQEELMNTENCTWTWDSSKNGYTVTSRINGNNIFLPAAGSYWSGTLSAASDYGEYWSRTLASNSSDSACYLFFRDGKVYMTGFWRAQGASVRPVRSK